MSRVPPRVSPRVPRCAVSWWAPPDQATLQRDLSSWRSPLLLLSRDDHYSAPGGLQLPSGRTILQTRQVDDLDTHGVGAGGHAVPERPRHDGGGPAEHRVDVRPHGIRL